MTHEFLIEFERPEGAAIAADNLRTLRVDGQVVMGVDHLDAPSRIALIDVAPTILRLFGLSTPPGMHESPAPVDPLVEDAFNLRVVA
jgi:hypothetical protein